MAKYQVTALEEHCTGCLRCQLACSELYTKTFNPALARIRVDCAGERCVLSFTEECIECGVCADHCFYDVLHKAAKEGE